MTKIKTIVLSVALVVATTVSSLGQGAPKPIIGAKGGLNLANVAGDVDNKTKVAGHFGIYSEVFFDYFLMMQAEFLLSFQGHAAQDATSGSLNLTYLNIPVMARYNLGYNFNVHAGVEFGFLLSAQSVFNDTKTDVKDQFKGMQLGLPLGVGYDFMDRKFSVTARYVIGLNDIADFTGGGTRRNNVFQISAGILLHRIGE